MEHSCNKYKTIDKLKEDINNVKYSIVAIETSNISVSESLKNVKKEIKLINVEIIKLSRSIDNKFTDIDKEKIKDLKQKYIHSTMIILTFISSIVIPIFLYVNEKG